jgi:hypothetical protein
VGVSSLCFSRVRLCGAGMRIPPVSMVFCLVVVVVAGGVVGDVVRCVVGLALWCACVSEPAEIGVLIERFVGTGLSVCWCGVWWGGSF